MDSKIIHTFAALLKKSTSEKKFWRDGRVVDRGGLENRCTERYRGFESLSLRKVSGCVDVTHSLFLFVFVINSFMRFLINNHTDPYYNMAFDEFCLENLELDEPVFYLWQNRPSVIIGANQTVNTEVNLEYLKEQDITLVRRLTGGGAVYHDWGNLNYTIVGKSDNLERDYPEYNLQVIKALQTMGIPATLSGRNDILIEGKKVSGFAKRVCRSRLMVHGTLMFDVDLDVLEQVLCPPLTKLQSKGIASVRSRVTNIKHYLPEMKDIISFKNHLEDIMSNNYTDKEYPLNDSHFDIIQKLVDNKFSKWEWIYGHSPKTTLVNSVHLSCGMIEVNLIIKENRIAFCQFSGDYLGNLPTAILERALIDTPYIYDNIVECLSKFDISQYFDHVTSHEVANLIMCR